MNDALCKPFAFVCHMHFQNPICKKNPYKNEKKVKKEGMKAK
jgi:hypothetical protein